MTAPTDMSTVWRGIGTPGKVAVAVACVAGLVVLPQVWRVLDAIIRPRPDVPARVASEASGQRAEQFELYIAQVDGRSLFHLPAAPGTHAAPPPPPGPPAPPPPPSSYGGPAIIAMVNGEVWFADGKRLRPGDAESEGVSVSSLNAPWEATLKWRGVEFKVPLFAREDLVWSRPPEPTKEPPPQPPPADPPHPGSAGDGGAGGEPTGNGLGG